VTSTSQDWKPLFDWIESHLGGRIVSRRRQGRESGGRPAWFVDVDVDGAIVRTYVRGERDAGFEYSKTYGVERESRILRVLYEAGIPVPEVLGYCPDPSASLLRFVEGRDDFNVGTDRPQREAILRHFVGLLADVHAIDCERFEAVGIERPRTPDELALNDLEIWYTAYERGTRVPDPLVVFATQWLRRNVPARLGHTCLIQGDTGPGNFLFEGERVTAIVDWELAHLGDPMLDLAQVRCRDLYYPIDDLAETLSLYAEASGHPLDLDALRYYSVKAMLITPLALAPVVENLTPEMDHAEWIAQHVFYKRVTPQALAEAIGIELEPVELPEAMPTPQSGLFDILVQNLREEQLPGLEDPFRRARMELTARLAVHLRNRENFAPAIEQQELDDVAALIGPRPANLADARRRLARWILDAGPDQDERLVRFLYRHGVREEFLMRDALGMAENGALSSITR
jgi:aminoglycoside phosphotransferase (APT) family kinase protein